MFGRALITLPLALAVPSALGCGAPQADSPAGDSTQKHAAAPPAAKEPAMEQIEEGVLVNDPSRPDLPVLTRSQVWAGLLMKAEDATKFVPMITYCKVIERFENGFIREINFRENSRIRERVTFEPEKRVRFEQMDGPNQGGWVDNILDEDANGALRLRFVFGIPKGRASEGPPPGGPEPGINSIYRQALESTLAAVRRQVQDGTLK